MEQQCKGIVEEIRGIEQRLGQLYQEQGRKEMNHKVSSLSLSNLVSVVVSVFAEPSHTGGET